MHMERDAVYKNINYVINEVTRLAEQLTPAGIAERVFENGNGS